MPDLIFESADVEKRTDHANRPVINDDCRR